jgi:putative transposase
MWVPVEHAQTAESSIRRGRGERVFAEAKDKEICLDTLGETVERTGWRIHAWVLMRTHYHLLIETPEPNLVDGMKWFQGTFTQRHNGYHGNRGHLFQRRYKAILIDDEHPEYFQRVADYIHLNPAAAKDWLAKGLETLGL